MKLQLLQFVNEAAAASDPVIGAYHFPALPDEGVPNAYWSDSNCFPDVGVWLNQVAQSGWWMIVATPDANTAIAQHAACRLAWDNDSAVILGGTYTGNEMSQLYVSPVPAGAYNPWNGPAPG